jgi:hypothetical protein
VSASCFVFNAVFVSPLLALMVLSAFARERGRALSSILRGNTSAAMGRCC